MDLPTPLTARRPRRLRRSALLFLGLSALSPLARAADIPPWELDTFDAGAGFATGALAGQNGWEELQKSAAIVSCAVDSGARCKGGGDAAQPGRGLVLTLNPNPGSGATVAVQKTVPSQSSGFHTAEFDVMITGAADPSLAKLELNTNPSTGWDKKFQVYFGTSIRVNYAPSGAAVTVVPSIQPRHWYHFRLALDLNTNGLNVWVDDELATPTPITVHPGPVVALSMTGWEFRAGKVYVDNLAGYRQLAKILAPARGITVSGTTTVSAQASSGVTAVEFYVDGALQAVQTAPPYGWPWNTAANPFPAPTHGGFRFGPFGFGYWLTQWKGQQATTDGCCFPEVADYTNLYHARTRVQYELSTGEDPAITNWLPRMEAGIAQARSLGKQVLVNLEIPYTCTRSSEADVTWCPALDTVLAMLVDYWDAIVAIELADEPTWAGNATAINTAINTLRTRLRDLGFGGLGNFRPVGLVFVHGGEPTSAFLSTTNLNFVSFEAYLNGPAGDPYQFSPLPWVNIARLNQLVTNLKSIAAGANKQVVLIGQSYTRNYDWPSVDLVRDLQTPPYLLSRSDLNVKALALFAYARASGAREFEDLQVLHRLIGARVLGAAPAQPPGNGPRTVAIRAIDSGGNSSWDFLEVHVSN